MARIIDALDLLDKNADAISAVLGLIGALAFAKAPMESLKSRKALFQVLGLSGDLPDDVLKAAREKLVSEAEDLFEIEERWNKWGAIFLALSFIVLIASWSYKVLHGESHPTAQTGITHEEKAKVH